MEIFAEPKDDVKLNLPPQGSEVTSLANVSRDRIEQEKKDWSLDDLWEPLRNGKNHE